MNYSPRQLGDLSKLADYIEQAFVDLEKAVFHPRSEIERPSKGRRKGRAKKARSA